MVVLGFIVEGATEKIILEQSNFFEYLDSQNIKYIKDVVDAEGNGNLLPQNLQQFTQILRHKGATKIFILTDLDTNQCFTNTKNRISAPADHYVVISSKSIEAWFLSDTSAMRSFLNSPDFLSPYPESIIDAYEEIRQLNIRYNGRGVSSKLVLANHLIKKHGFSITRAAEHDNCNCAKYFLAKLREATHTI